MPTLTMLSNSTMIRNMIVLPSRILCNKSRILDIYTSLLEYVTSIKLDIYTLLVIKINDKKILLISDCEYKVCIFDKDTLTIINTGNLSINNKKKSISTKSFFNLNNDILKYYLYGDNIIVYNTQLVSVYNFKDNILRLDDFPNDLHYYKILFVNCISRRINIVVQDVEDSVYLLKYEIQSQLVLNKKIKKWCSFIFEYKHGYLLINESVIWYEINNKKVCESEWGNMSLCGYVVCGDRVVMSMENGEIICVWVEYKVISDCKDIKNKESITVDMKICIKVHKLNSSYTSLIQVGSYILGHTILGRCVLLYINHSCDIKIHSHVDSISRLTQSLYQDHKILFYNDKYKVRVSKYLKYKIIKKYNKEVEMFYMYNGLVILVSKVDTVYMEKGKEILKLNRIYAFHKYDEVLYFQMKDGVYKMEKGNGINRDSSTVYNNITCIKSFPEILICSFYKNDFVVYDSYFTLSTSTSSMHTEYNISCIVYNEFIYLSTYNNLFVVLDNTLRVVHEVVKDWFTMGCNIYLYGSDDILYQINNFKEKFASLQSLGLYKGITNILSIDNQVFLLSSNLIYIDTQILSIPGIKYITKYKNKWYINNKEGIYELIIKTSEYKCKKKRHIYLYSDKNTKIYNKNNQGIIKYKDNKPIYLNLIKKVIYKRKLFYILICNELYKLSKKDLSLFNSKINKEVEDIQLYDKKILFSTYNKIYTISKKENRILISVKGIIKYWTVNYNNILIIDTYRGFSIFNLKDKSMYKNIYKGIYNTGIIHKLKGIIYFILAYDKGIRVYDKDLVLVKDMEVERVVGFSVGEVEVNKEYVYCTTEEGCIWRIEI